MLTKISRAEAIPGGVNQGADGVEAGDVSLDDLSFAAGVFDGAGGLFGPVGVTYVVDDDLGPVCAETLGDSLPYAGAGPGDDGDFAL